VEKLDLDAQHGVGIRTVVRVGPAIWSVLVMACSSRSAGWADRRSSSAAIVP
jgi:hypothetical protein